MSTRSTRTHTRTHSHARAAQAQAAPDRKGIVRWAVKQLAYILVSAAALFLSAGRLDWAWGWAFLAVGLFVQLLVALVLLPKSPDLIAERSKLQCGSKRWDVALAMVVAMIGPLAMMIAAGLDERFKWSVELPLWLHGLALAVMLGSSLFTLWAMAENRFFSGTVRIQKDRGHKVVSSGPYRIVRHPGYLGALLYTLVVPLALGSLWALVPSVLTAAVIFIRTDLEDRTLKAELHGYREYARKTKRRLVPGVW